MVLQPLHGLDIDVDELADALRRLGDGIDDGDVAVMGASTGHDVDSDDASTFSLSVSYVATSEEYTDVLEYVDRDDGGDGDESVGSEPMTRDEFVEAMNETRKTTETTND